MISRFLIGVLKTYRLLLSPVLGNNCRFYPSCSSFGIEALETHGAARGTLLTLGRLCRCHPFHPGGCDPVPPAKQKSRPE